MLKEKVIKAYNLSKELHEGQMRKYSNHPYHIHPKYVARIIEDLTNDEDLICVALLHDTLEMKPNAIPLALDDGYSEE